MQERDRCKLFHTWFVAPSDWFNARESMGGVPLTLRCDNCGTERRDTYGTNTGELVTRRYVHPEGYLTQKGEQRLDRASLRLLLAREALSEMRKRRRRAS